MSQPPSLARFLAAVLPAAPVAAGPILLLLLIKALSATASAVTPPVTPVPALATAPTAADSPAIGSSLVPVTPLVQPAPRPAPAGLRIDVPVAFQLTRTRLLGPGSTTVTESFRETWTIEVLPGDILNLRSPRATVPAYESSAHATSYPSVPKTVVVSERDFARLVGVEPKDRGADEESGEAAATPSPPAGPVTLNLGKSGRGGTDINLNWSEEEHYAVHIDVGATSIF